MSRKDEYNDIYLKDDGFGFEYTYKNHTLGKERIIHPEDVKRIEPSKYNGDKTLIRCGKCNVYMDYIHSLRNSFSGKWLCPKCGTYIRETTVNRYIEGLPDIMDTDYDDIY